MNLLEKYNNIFEILIEWNRKTVWFAYDKRIIKKLSESVSPPGERRPSTFMDCSSHFDWSLGIFRQLVIHTDKLRNSNTNSWHSYQLHMPVRCKKPKLYHIKWQTTLQTNRISLADELQHTYKVPKSQLNTMNY